jgi:hypothetical protein
MHYTNDENMNVYNIFTDKYYRENIKVREVKAQGDDEMIDVLDKVLEVTMSKTLD